MSVKQLAELRRLKYAATINDEALSEDTDAEYEMQYVDIGAVDSFGSIQEIVPYQFADAPSRARRRARHGDVIISCVRTYLQAIAPIVDPPINLIVSTGFAVVRPLAGVLDPSFGKYALREPGFLAEVEKRSVGVSYPAINASDLADIAIHLPPLSQQSLVAGYLDGEMARLDELVAAKQRVLGLIAEKRRALIAHTVTRGLDSRVSLRSSSIPWLGEVPAHWQIPPVYSRFEVQLGKMLDEKKIKGAYLAPYLRNVDVQWGEINTSDLPEMDFDDDDKLRYALRPGDILVCEGGEIGRCAQWNGDRPECYYQKALHRLRPIGDRDNPAFFVLVMRAMVESGQFALQSSASTIQHLPAEKLRVVRYPAPPLEEQQAIVKHITEETAKLDALRMATERMIALIKERRAALITDAVTGRVNSASTT